MKQLVFNFIIGSSCYPILLLIRKLIGNEVVVALWVGFCAACLINGFICLVKEE